MNTSSQKGASWQQIIEKSRTLEQSTRPKALSIPTILSKRSSGTITISKSISEVQTRLTQQKSIQRSKKMLIIIQIESILVNITVAKPDSCDSYKINIPSQEKQTKNEQSHVLKRPDAEYFLRQAMEICEVWVQSALPIDTCRDIMSEFKQFVKLPHICIRPINEAFLQDLQASGRELKNVLLINDNERTYKRVNSVCLSKFEGDARDQELEKMLLLLQDSELNSDFRLVCKKYAEIQKLKHSKTVRSGSILQGKESLFRKKYSTLRRNSMELKTEEIEEDSDLKTTSRKISIKTLLERKIDTTKVIKASELDTDEGSCEFILSPTIRAKGIKAVIQRSRGSIEEPNI